MFKLAVFIRSDGITMNPFKCKYLYSYLSNGIIVLTQNMFELIGGTSKLQTFSQSKIIVIGDEMICLENGLNDNGATVFVPNINTCIQYLSSNYPGQSWWFIGDNTTANNMIWQGLIMDVHISKSYTMPNMKNWNAYNKDLLVQSELFNKTLLNNPNMEFDLISSARDDAVLDKTLRHYMRRNVEENNLLYAMNRIITHGFKRPNRTGVDTRSLFGQQFEYRMKERIDPNTGESSFRLPLLTTKKMFTRGVFGELKWFLNAGTDSKILENQKINIWKGNTTRDFLDANGHEDYAEGQCGPIYGHQWRHFGAEWNPSKTDYTGEGVDQVANVIESLQKDPYSRRHIISGWAPDQLSKMCLPPCHVLYQFLVHEEEGQMYLSLMMTQRSADVFLGVPFNICSLGMFLLMMAHRVGYKPYKIIHSVADFHLYETHIEAATTQIKREPCMFPYIRIDCDPKELESYEYNDIIIEDYHSHGAIKADMVA